MWSNGNSFGESASNLASIERGLNTEPWWWRLMRPVPADDR